MREEREKVNQVSKFVHESKINEKNVYIYGNGHCGSLLKNMLGQLGIEIKAFVVSDNQLIADERIKDTIYIKAYDNDCKDNILIYAIYDKSVLYSLIANNIRVLEWPFEYE